MQRVNDVYDRIRNAPRLLAIFNVRWLLHSGHPTLGLSHNFVKSVDGAAGLTHRDGAVFEIDGPAPAAYWVQGARVERTVAEAIAHLDELDTRGELVLTDEDVGAIAPERRMAHAPRKAAQLERRTLSSVRFSVDAPAAGYLVVNETWFAGWHATVDDRPAAILRGNVIMQAVEVPAGRHVVEVRFRPGYVLYPLALALVAWIAALGWALRGYGRGLRERLARAGITRRRRRESPGAVS